MPFEGLNDLAACIIYHRSLQGNLHLLIEKQVTLFIFIRVNYDF